MLIFSGQKVASARIYTFPCLAVLALSQHSLNTNQNWVNTSPGQKHRQWSQKKHRQWSWKYDQLSWLFLRWGSWGRIGGALGGGGGQMWEGGVCPHACMQVLIFMCSFDDHHFVNWWSSCDHAREVYVRALFGKICEPKSCWPYLKHKSWQK